MYTEPFVSIVSIAPQLLHSISPLYLHAPSLGLYARWSNGGYNVSIFHEILDATSILVVEFSEMGGSTEGLTGCLWLRLEQGASFDFDRNSRQQYITVSNNCKHWKVRR